MKRILQLTYDDGGHTTKNTIVFGRQRYRIDDRIKACKQVRSVYYGRPDGDLVQPSQGRILLMYVHASPPNQEQTYGQYDPYHTRKPASATPSVAASRNHKRNYNLEYE